MQYYSLEELKYNCVNIKKLQMHMDVIHKIAKTTIVRGQWYQGMINAQSSW